MDHSARVATDRAYQLPKLHEDSLEDLETDRELVARVFAAEPDEHVTIDIEEPGETPGPTEVMMRPPVFVLEDFPRPSVRVPAPGYAFVPEALDSEPRTLTGLHGLHDLMVEEDEEIGYLPTQLAPLPVMPRVRTQTQRMPVADLPSVLVETSSIAPMAMDLEEDVPREIVLRSLLSPLPPPPFDDERSSPTTVLARPPVQRRRSAHWFSPRKRGPLVGAAVGMAAALGIAATFALVTTWRSTTTGAHRAAAAAPPPAMTVDAGAIH